LRAIFAIGNQGKRYQLNRHNAGFLLLDMFSASFNFELLPAKGDYYFFNSQSNKNPFLLIKPSCYVNQSGLVARQVIDQFSIAINDFLVLVDDINLNLGQFRIRKSGGDGGHNGLASIIYALDSKNFPRVRIGVGKEFTNGSMAEHVLSNFNEIEIIELKNTFIQLIPILEKFLIGGVSGMLDSYSKSKNFK
jgi:PTH1 family peptidyl-tRNA hydrolase